MSTTIESTDLTGEGRALALVPASPQPWYMTPPAILDRQALEDEHSRILAHAVGNHLPYELALRAAAVAEQLQHRA
jgi:hypothetical protein